MNGYKQQPGTILKSQAILNVKIEGQNNKWIITDITVGSEEMQTLQ